jgi:hypothetical protein
MMVDSSHIPDVTGVLGETTRASTIVSSGGGLLIQDLDRN